MRQFVRLSTEILFVALLYTAVSIVLGVGVVGWGTGVDLLRLLLVNLLTIVPLVFLVWKVDGTWWSIGAACALSLAVLQVVVPRLEYLLERQASLAHVPSMVLNALGAAIAGSTALLFILRGANDWDRVPPFLLPAGSRISYVWRLPAWVAAYAALQTLASQIGRAVFRQKGGPLLLDEFLSKVAVGVVAGLAVMLLAAHLGARSRSRTALLLAVGTVLPLGGRWLMVSAWPVSFAAVRLASRMLADSGAMAVASMLFLLPLRPRRPDSPVGRDSKPAGDDCELESADQALPVPTSDGGASRWSCRVDSDSPARP